MSESVAIAYKEVFKMMPSWYLEKPLGEYVAAYNVEAGNKIQIEKAASGGAITAFLCYLIDHGAIDGVIAAKKAKGLEGEIVVARTKEEIISTAGSRWQVLPFTLKLKETVEKENLNKMAIVGLPCQVNFLRQMKTFPLLETDFSNRIKFLISLFCFGTFAQESILSYIKEKYGMKASEIKEVKISQREIKFIGEREVEVPFDELSKYLQVGCLLCPDYTGIASDISTGFVEDKTVMIVRNEVAEKMLREAHEMNYIKMEEITQERMERIEKRAIEKISRASKYMAQIL
ncbi:MAG: coenzyme F420 hydrogenase [Thermoplasmata archaeon]|nr:MAG: coenzyme F420 hydrogenase [Thermoplasmata archaeon]